MIFLNRKFHVWGIFYWDIFRLTPKKYSQSLIRIASADVIRVNVDVLPQSSFHDLSRTQHEALEILRQDNHLFLLLRELFHCKQKRSVEKFAADRSINQRSPCFTSSFLCSWGVIAGATSLTVGRPCGRMPGGSFEWKPWSMFSECSSSSP